MFVNRVPKRAAKRLARLATVLMVMLGGIIMVTPAVASTTTASVSRVLLIKQANLVLVYPTGGIHDPATCASGGGGSYYSFTLSGTGASTYLTALLAAQVSGATVTFYGSNSCAAQPNLSLSESLSNMSVN